MRSVRRVVEASCWVPDAIKKIAGAPSKLCPLGDEDIAADIEKSDMPHSNLDVADAGDAELAA